jgi:hypothetical protein
LDPVTRRKAQLKKMLGCAGLQYVGFMGGGGGAIFEHA